jgi:hypothetical protein
MMAARKVLVFPFEVLLAVCVAIHMMTEGVCLLVGAVCRLIDGADE